MPVVNRSSCAECSSPDVAYLRTRSPAAGTLRLVQPSQTTKPWGVVASS